MDFPNLFSPIKLGPLTLKNRIGGSCTTTGGADINGYITEECLYSYAARSEGGAGFITIECTFATDWGAKSTSFGNPRRTANGIDFNRLLLLIAVLSKRVGVRLSDQDIFVNVVGGLRVGEPAADLAVACAIASSFRDVPVAGDLAIVGEVGLSGELRTVSQLEVRLKEAAKLGFNRCLVPESRQLRKTKVSGLEIISAHSLAQTLEIALVA